MRIEKFETGKIFKHSRTDRAWGTFDNYADNRKCTVKILNIKPGERLSLQYHFKRDQLYVALDPVLICYSVIPFPYKKSSDRDYIDAFISLNLKRESAIPGDIFGFKRFYLHTAINPSKVQAVKILDIAFGKNDETDIVRLYDKYGRADVLRLKHE